MCFSATASFAAGGGLIALGGASFVAAKKEDKIIAAIPLMFGVQQLFEGIQWLYLNNGQSSVFAGYAFLFFAFIVWPIYSPAFIYVLDKKNRIHIKKFIFLGIVVALYSVGIAVTKTLSIQELGSCVSYDFHYSLGWFLTMLYLLAVFGAFFVSSRKILKLFGAAFAFFAIVSWIIYTNNFVSVWCFFAAIVSSVFFIYVKFKSKFV
jgi:hypothetical protein